MRWPSATMRRRMTRHPEDDAFHDLSFAGHCLPRFVIPRTMLSTICHSEDNALYDLSFRGRCFSVRGNRFIVNCKSRSSPALGMTKPAKAGRSLAPGMTKPFSCRRARGLRAPYGRPQLFQVVIRADRG